MAANTSCSIDLEPRTLSQVELTEARVDSIFLHYSFIPTPLVCLIPLPNLKRTHTKYNPNIDQISNKRKWTVESHVDNLCCFMQELAAEVVQKLEPSEASALFVEVWFPQARIFYMCLSVF